MDDSENEVLEVGQEDADSEAAFLQKTHLLGELSKTISLSLLVSPIVSTAIIEHVFQELLKQFYQKGMAYLPNFGLLRYSSKDCSFDLSPCESFCRVMDQMKEADDAESECLALVERRMAECLSEE